MLFVVVAVRAGSTYAVGRAVQAGLRQTRLAHALSSPAFTRAQGTLARWGAPVITASFLTVGLQTVLNLAAGVGRMPLRHYVPALLVGSVLWAFLYASVGFATFAAWRRLYDLYPVAAVSAATALVTGLAAYVIWRVRQRRGDNLEA
jgi:membrane protein DedA with SNARE-associated domain